MSDAAVSLAFFDGGRSLHGSLRSGVGLLFEGEAAHTLDAPPEIAADGEGYRVSCGAELELEFAPCSPAVDLGGSSARLARVSGRAAGGAVECLGTIGETVVPPSWSEIEALRTISAVFDESHAVLAVARRPVGVAGHGDERVTAYVLGGEEPLAVEDARISTVYDGDGRQRSAGLELWLPEEDFPRRASGVVRAGVSLAFEGELRVNAAVFGWSMEGREGFGAYELTVREEPAAAA